MQFAIRVLFAIYICNYFHLRFPFTYNNINNTLYSTSTNKKGWFDNFNNEPDYIIMYMLQQ